MKKVKSNWYLILTVVRQATLNGDRPITSRDIAREREFRALYANKERMGDYASAWLHKLEKWGYVRKAGITRGSFRWMRLYALTKYGGKRKEPKHV